jgi:hypothetical protein
MIVKLQVPNNAQMGYGLGKCIQYGIEYNVLDNLEVELTGTDEIKLTKMCVAFQGKVLEVSKTKPTLGDLPKHEVQYARTNKKRTTPRKN